MEELECGKRKKCDEQKLLFVCSLNEGNKLPPPQLVSVISLIWQHVLTSEGLTLGGRHMLPI